MELAEPYRSTSVTTEDPPGMRFTGRDMTTGTDVDLTLAEPTPLRPRLASWKPAGGGVPGYFALWLPVDETLGPPVRPAVTIITDLSHDVGHDVRSAVTETIERTIDELPEDTPFGLTVNGRTLTAPGPAPASPQRKQEAQALLAEAGSAQTMAGLDDDLAEALAASVTHDLEDRPHHVLLVTDEDATADSEDTRQLLRQLESRSAGGLRLSALRLAGALAVDAFPDALARVFTGDSMGGGNGMVPDVAARLDRLTAGISAPAISVDDVYLAGAGVSDRWPRPHGWHPVGSESLHTGRYLLEGDVELEVSLQGDTARRLDAGDLQLAEASAGADSSFG